MNTCVKQENAYSSYVYQKIIQVLSKVTWADTSSVVDCFIFAMQSV